MLDIKSIKYGDEFLGERRANIQHLYMKGITNLKGMSTMRPYER